MVMGKLLLNKVKTATKNRVRQVLIRAAPMHPMYGSVFGFQEPVLRGLSIQALTVGYALHLSRA
jgi:hypothetical protein